MLKKITEYWANAWKESKLLFFCEAIATLANVAASLALAALTPDPPLVWVFTGYLIGSILLQYTMLVRKMAWMGVLMGWYTGMNIIGLANAL